MLITNCQKKSTDANEKKLSGLKPDLLGTSTDSIYNWRFMCECFSKKPNKTSIWLRKFPTKKLQTPLPIFRHRRYVSIRPRTVGFTLQACVSLILSMERQARFLQGWPKHEVIALKRVSFDAVYVCVGAHLVILMIVCNGIF